MIVDGTPKTTRAERPEARSPLLRELLARVARGERRIELCGEPTSFFAFILAQLQQLTQRTLVLVVDREDLARDLSENLQFFCGPGAGLDPVVLLPQLDQNPYRQSAPARREMMSFLAGLTRLNQGLGVEVIVTTSLALARKTVPPSVLSAFADVVAKGEDLDRDAFLRRLVDGGYQSVSLVEDPGTFAVRGGLIDVFSPLYPTPMRIDLFGDEVESIRFFDPETQRTCGEIDEAYVGPVREVLLHDGATSKVERRLRELADSMELPSSTIRRLLDDLRHEIYFFGIESLLPAFHDELVPMFAHIPAGSLWVTINNDRFGSEVDGFRDGLAVEYASALEHQQLCFAPTELFSSGDELAAALDEEGVQRLDLVPFTLGERELELRLDAEQHLGLQREIENRSDREHVLQPFVDHVRAWLDEGVTVLLVASYRSQAQRWFDLLEPYPLELHVSEETLTPALLGTIRRDPRRRAYMVIGRLNGGFVDHQSRLALIGYEELFGRKVHKPRRRSDSPFSTDFQDLRPDDLVVHVDHGIGCYRGLVTLSVGGIDFDFMRIDYRGDDKLYVPVAQLNKVQKLTGAEKPPPLAKLGTATWVKTKGKVKAAVREMADELLRLYAQRAASPGHAFAPPTPTSASSRRPSPSRRRRTRSG